MVVDFDEKELLELDLEVKFNGVDYRVVDNLMSNFMLVVKKEDYDNGRFPIQTYIIPIVD